jgi:hypothetical protein
MNEYRSDRLPSDLEWVGEQLEEHRPQATPLELDRIKLTARRQAHASRSRSKGSILKSRVAILAVCALGLMLSGVGAAGAISGSSGDVNAATQSYPDFQTPPGENGTSGGQTLAGQEEGVGEEAPSGGGGVEAGAQPQAAAQEVATASDSGLPFTGFAAIPVLLGGIVLLGAGLLLGYRARDTRE